MSATRETRFISADSHIYEPVDLFTSRMRGKFKDKAPRIESRPENDYYILEGVPPTPLGIDGAILEQKLKGGTVEHGFKGNRHSDARPQAADPKRRVEDMDLDNILAEVLYPNTWEFRIWNAPDAEYAQECVRAYNDFLAEFCSAFPKRYIGAAMISCKGPLEWSIEEVKRVAKMGYRTVNLPVDVFEKPYSTQDRYYDPLWALLQETGIVVSLHIGTNTAPGGASMNKIKELKVPVAAIASTQRMMPQTLGDFIGGGICQRFPNLKIVMVECGIGWIPSVLRFMDKFWKTNRKWMEPILDEPPSYYFKRQMYATFEGGKEDLAARQFLGTDRFLWGSDYPHTEGTFPRSKQDVEEDFVDISDVDVRKMTYENSAALYRVDA